MQRTPVSGGIWHPRVYSVHQELQVLERRLRQHSMAEVEDVAAASAGPPENLAGSLLDHLTRRQQDRRVEVALDSAPDADPPPALVEGHPPIQADQVGTGA